MFLKFYQRFASKLVGYAHKLQQQFLALDFSNKARQQPMKNNLISLKNRRNLFQRTFIGLDISTSHLAWVQIYPIRNQVALVKNYDIIDFQENSRGVADALKKIGATMQSHLSVGVALPDALVEKTTLTLDANLSVFQLRQIFKQKSAELLNKSIQEIYFQYQVLGFSKNQPNQLHFLLVAVLKQTISDTCIRLKTSHLKPQLIDVASFARERGEEILKNRRLQLDTAVPNFFQHADRLAIGVGLAMHPGLKKRW